MVSPRDEIGERVGMTWEPQQPREGFISLDDLVVGTVMQLESGIVIGYAMGERLGSFGKIDHARETVIQRVTRKISGQDESVLLPLTKTQASVVLELAIAALNATKEKSTPDLEEIRKLDDDIRTIIRAIEARGIRRIEP